MNKSWTCAIRRHHITHCLFNTEEMDGNFHRYYGEYNHEQVYIWRWPWESMRKLTCSRWEQMNNRPVSDEVLSDLDSELITAEPQAFFGFMTSYWKMVLSWIERTSESIPSLIFQPMQLTWTVSMKWQCRLDSWLEGTWSLNERIHSSGWRCDIWLLTFWKCLTWACKALCKNLLSEELLGSSVACMKEWMQTRIS